MSKRQLEQRDALTAGQDTDWGDDLLPPEKLPELPVGPTPQALEKPAPA